MDPRSNSDIRFSVSRNGGRSWSAPVKVTDETTPTDQFMPWIATHPDGLVSIVWLDKRLDPIDNKNYDVFYTNTFDGKTFLPKVRVSTASSNIGSTLFIRDYIGMAATDNLAVPVWNDTLSGTPAVFTATGTLAP